MKTLSVGLANERKASKDRRGTDSMATRDFGDWSVSPHGYLVHKDLQEQISMAVDALPDHYRRILFLHEGEQLDYASIAVVLGISRDEVGTRLSCARGMIRRRIKPYYRFSKQENVQSERPPWDTRG